MNHIILENKIELLTNKALPRRSAYSFVAWHMAVQERQETRKRVFPQERELISRRFCKCAQTSH